MYDLIQLSVNSTLTPPNMMENFLSTSNSNSYVPFYSLWTNYIIHRIEGSILIYYSIPFRKDETMYRAYNYSEIFSRFCYTLYPSHFRLRSMRSSKFVCFKGLIYELTESKTPRIMLILCVKSSSINSVRRGNLSIRDFALFVSTDFSMNPDYKNFYNKVKKDIITPHQERGLTIIHTPNIMSWCFERVSLNPRFSTTEEMSKYLSKFKNFKYL